MRAKIRSEAGAGSTTSICIFVNSAMSATRDPLAPRPST